MQNRLATEFSDCSNLPDDTVEQLINRLKDICATTVNNPGEAIKRLNSSWVFAQTEARRDMSWTEYCTGIKDQATQNGEAFDCCRACPLVLIESF